MEDFPILLEFKEATKHGNMAIEQMTRSYNETLNIIEDMEKIVVAKDQAMERDVVEITKLRKNVEELTQRSAEKDGRHSKELEELLDDAKRNAAIAHLRGQD